MAKKPVAVVLEPEERRSLNDLVRKGVHGAREVTRARILLRLDGGLTPSQVQAELGTSEATVYNVRQRYRQHGLEVALKDRPRSGQPQRFSGQVRAEITALACSTPPSGHAQWTLRLLADKAVELQLVDAISYNSVKRILKKTS